MNRVEINMEDRIAGYISNKLRAGGVIDPEYEEVYKYGLELVLSFLFSTAVIIAVGAAIGKLLPALVFLAVFISVRRFTGGYHADTYLKCKLTTVSVYLIVSAASSLFDVGYAAFIICAVTGLAVILLFAPIENPNKPLTTKSKRRNRIIGLVFYESLVCAAEVFVKIDHSVSDTICFSLFSILFLMIFAIFKGRRKCKNEKDR